MKSFLSRIRFGWKPLALLALFLLVAGARFWMVEKYTAPLPYCDSWNGEGSAVIIPWLEGRLHFADLFVPHNEHRIFTSRVLTLALFIANRQWDAQVGATVDALIWAGFAAALAAALLRLFAPDWRWSILAAVGVCFIAPFGWENLLWSFESGNYFLILFSLTAIWGMGQGRIARWQWWLGLTCNVLACLSAGSGLMAALAIIGIRALRNLKARTWPSLADGVTGAICAVFCAICLKFRVVVPQHAPLMATTLSSHVLALGHYLAWPFYGHPLLALWMFLPLALLTAAYLCRPLLAWGEADSRKRRLVELLLAVGLWLALLILAMAHTRGATSAMPASRYKDFFAISVLLNFFSWLALMRETGAYPFWRRAVQAAAVLWTALLAYGIVLESREAFRDSMPQFLADARKGEQSVRGYVLTHDYQRFLADKPQRDLPFPFVPWLAQILDTPSLRPYLPEDIREPIPLQEDSAEDPSPFVSGGFDAGTETLAMARTWGSYTPSGAAAAQATWHGHFASSPERPYLRFYFSGYLGEPGLDFALRARADNGSADWHPKKASGERWHGEAMRKPGSDLRIEASDRSSTRWFAFSEPVEIGRLSYWTSYLRRRASLIFGAGWLILAGLAVASLAPRVTGFRARSTPGDQSD